MRMKRLSVIIAFCAMLILTGCLYPAELRKENQVPPDEFIMLVQHAVDRYLEKTGVLPIKNSTLDTPLYEKYKIDFRRLQNQHMLSTIPANAFENGGVNLYVLVNVETKPEVKLLDLGLYQQVGDLQRKVDEFVRKNDGELPTGEVVSEGFYQFDYGKLGIQAPQIRSPFSRQYLPLVIHDSGKLAIDYRLDMMNIVEKTGVQTVDLRTDFDLRELLVADSYFVPVHSHPYRWIDGEPVILYVDPDII